MSFDFKNCSEEKLWKFVGEHLSKCGFDAVLVGGAVVSIYSAGAYRSGDLDFIVQNLFKDDLPKAMAEIGFLRTNRHYIHPDCDHLFIEFPPGPLSIGDDYRIIPNKIKSNGKELKILSPTDCIKDRLASYIHFKSREGFDQALLVAKAQAFNQKEIKRWCQAEGSPEVFDEFINSL